MATKKRKQSTTFRHEGQTYNILNTVTVSRQRFWIVEQWPEKSSTPYHSKAFQPGLNEWVSIRVRRKDDVSKRKLTKIRDLVQVGRRTGQNLPRVRFYDADDSYEYLVTDWLNALPLAVYLEENKPKKLFFALNSSYYLVRGLVKGLQRLHRASIVHGDISPSNVLLGGQTGDRSTWYLALIDFGTAWFSSQARTRVNESTPGYASPEWWREEKLIDHRSDQFSTSMILYEMLTGEKPYEKLGGMAALDPNPPSLIEPSLKNPGVWPSLSKVVSRGLELDPNRRYETTPMWFNAINEAAPPTGLIREVMEYVHLNLFRKPRAKSH